MKIDETSVKSQIIEFVDKCIDEDYIVVGVLRFGAHIPHIYQNACIQSKRQPRPINLLLSHMIPFFSKDFYAKNKFILLDDTVYRGIEMKNIKSTLKALGVPDKNIRTATLIAHEGSEFTPDYPIPTRRLREAEYIAWKEVLGSIVANDLRPTERDHPLYFFGAENIKVSQFLNILENYGEIHSVGTSNSDVLKFSLTIDSDILIRSLKLKGVDLGSTYKIRFYWKQTSDAARFTVVPMGFPIIDLDKFIESGSSRILAGIIGLKDSFYEDLHSPYNEKLHDHMLNYFASRSIAALLLRLLIEHIAPRIQFAESQIELYWPDEIDDAVHYVFPQEYKDFYKVVFNMLDEVIKPNLAIKTPSLFDTWKKPENEGLFPQKDPLLPNIYSILSFLVKNVDPAIWDGKRWEPNDSYPYNLVSYQNLLLEFKNKLFVSRALDELLESGLLRAKDAQIDGPNRCFTRVFLPGGEYNAVAVSRIAETLRYKSPFTIDINAAEEESIELWGPY